MIHGQKNIKPVLYFRVKTEHRTSEPL